MAVHVQRSNDAPAIERIRSQRRSAGQSRSCKDAVSIVREVVRRSATVDDAISAVSAVNTAWSKTTSKTCEASDFLLTILELSDSVAEAVSVVEMLRNDTSLRKPLANFRQFVNAEFPGARMRIVPGDGVSSAYLYVLVPTKDYPSLWAAHIRIRDWWIMRFPELGGIIHPTTRSMAADV